MKSNTVLKENTPSDTPTVTPLPTHEWDLDVFEKQHWIKSIFLKNAKSKYPVKLLRYWFTYHLILQESERLGRPLRVCEIGVDRGQMLKFMKDCGFNKYSEWTAVDVIIQPELNVAGYTRVINANVENTDFKLDQQYDVIITLHFLEHLVRPEQFVEQLRGYLTDEGVLIGGFPVTPKKFEAWWEGRLRAKARKFGHVSVFSPNRVREMAIQAGMGTEFLSGAFLMRKSDSFIENSRKWMRFNLWFGSRFPSMGGEIYWKLRKSAKVIKLYSALFCVSFSDLALFEL